jgi:hypothetical protein
MDIAVPSVVCSSCIDVKLEFMDNDGGDNAEPIRAKQQLAAVRNQWAYMHVVRRYACTLSGVFIGADGD